MSEYTPTTEQLRDALVEFYLRRAINYEDPIEVAEGVADRALAAHNAEMRAAAVVAFVTDQSARYGKHSGVAIEEDMALAIGRYGAKLTDFFDEADAAPEYMSDYLLAQIARLQNEEAADV